MAETDNKKLRSYEFRAKLPRFLRYIAVAGLTAAVLVVVAGFYRARSKQTFKLKGEHAHLSTDVIAEVNNYERLETDNGVAKYYVKAGFAKTFSDQHQEFQNVYLEVYDEEGRTDKLAGDSGLYVPAENKDFTAYLNGNVKIETKDALKVTTDQATYTRSLQQAESDDLVQFERDNVRGHSTGAKILMGEKRIDLAKDVEIETFESPELMRSGVRYAKIDSSSASFDQGTNLAVFNGDVKVNIASRSRSTGKPLTTDVAANRATAFFTGKEAKTAALDRIELFDSVHITSVEEGASSTNVDAGYALFNKAADTFDLKKTVHIISSSGDRPSDVRAEEAFFDRAAPKLALTGNVEITQLGNYLKGDSVNADLFTDNKIKNAVVRGNALARQTTDQRSSTITAPELDAAFGESRDIQTAKAVGESSIELVPATAAQYSKMTTLAANGLSVRYKGPGQIDQMSTDGRTNIVLTAPPGLANAANKKLTADKVTSTFGPDGKDLSRAEALGNAELYVEPTTTGPKNYKTTINAPSFDCNFFPAGNEVEKCVAGKKTRTVRVPTVPDAAHGEQTITADQMTANFGQATRDVERLDLAGNAKFNERDRTAIAGEMSFTNADGMLRLRGGEPTAWDSRARVRAREIDWDTRAGRSSYRGGVSTTYYNPKQMNGSAPFATADSPVYLTADSAEMDHNAQTAVYSGNARGWQENNFVRADKITLDEAHSLFNAEGRVESALYSAKTKGQKGRSDVPTYASASSMTYARDERVLHYRGGVDMRQGTDRITAGSADIFLNDRNEMSRTVAESNVVVTQPNRRATGSWAQYTTEDEVAILKGEPATISDSVNGSSESSQITFSMRDNKVVSEAKTKQNPNGRSRSVYKVRPN